MLPRDDSCGMWQLFMARQIPSINTARSTDRRNDAAAFKSVNENQGFYSCSLQDALKDNLIMCVCDEFEQTKSLKIVSCQKD